MAKQIQVKFYRDNDGSWKGSVEADDGRKPERSKIVFPGRGVKPPTEGGSWICQEIKDTKPENPGRGALIVRPIRPVKGPEWHLVPDPEWPELFGVSYYKLRIRKGLVFEDPARGEGPPEEAQLRLLEANEAYEEAKKKLLVWALKKCLELKLPQDLETSYTFDLEGLKVMVGAESGGTYLTEVSCWGKAGRLLNMGSLGVELVPSPYRDWTASLKALGQPEQWALDPYGLNARWGKVWFTVPEEVRNQVEPPSAPSFSARSGEVRVSIPGWGGAQMLVGARPNKTLKDEGNLAYWLPVARDAWRKHALTVAREAGLLMDSEQWKEHYRSLLPLLEEEAKTLLTDASTDWQRLEKEVFQPGTISRRGRTDPTRPLTVVFRSPSGKEVTAGSPRWDSEESQHQEYRKKRTDLLTGGLRSLRAQLDRARRGGPEVLLSGERYVGYEGPIRLLDPRLDVIESTLNRIERILAEKA